LSQKCWAWKFRSNLGSVLVERENSWASYEVFSINFEHLHLTIHESKWAKIFSTNSHNSIEKQYVVRNEKNKIQFPLNALKMAILEQFDYY